MSAIAAIFRRDGAPTPDATVAAIADRLGHRGPDGRERWADGGAALTHLHHWATPEEVGERQPVQMGDWVLALDGRLDNREELARALGLGDDAATMSDARLLLAALAAWGKGTWRRLVGPFAAVAWDRGSGDGLLVRDGLGDRTLFYADLGAELAVASEEHALLAHPSLSGGLDERRLVAYFAGETPGDGSTFFAGVRELEPGVVVRFGPSGFRARRYWTVSERDGSELGNEGEAAEWFRETLGQAVTSRLRARNPVAILMSGGIDSTSLAALTPSAERAAGRVRAVSWVFDDLADCDERAYIEPVVEHLGLQIRQLLADELGPEPDDESLCSSPSGPEESPYRRLKTRAYQTAASWGCDVVLSGGSADVLYTGFERWVGDLLQSRRWGRALTELLADLGRSGLRTGLRRAGVARAAGFRTPRWLTPEAAVAWRDMAPPGGSSRLRAVAGPRAARSISAEVFHAARAGIDLRHPYRDRRLVELMLGMPAYRLYRHGRFKPIARRALAGRLPEIVLERTRPTLLTPLFDRALRGPRRNDWRALLEGSNARWPRYVRRDWIEAALERSAGPAGDVALWNCVAFELWRQRFSR